MSASIPGGNGLINSGYLVPSAPFVDPRTGLITSVWWRFLMSLLARTGGAQGIISNDVELLASLGLLTGDQVTDPDILAAMAIDTADAPTFPDATLGLTIQGIEEMPQTDAFPALYDEALSEDSPLAALALPDDVAKITGAWQWASGGDTTAVAADTYTVMGWAPFPGAVTALKGVVGPAAVGSLTETVKINGVAVTGINGVTVNAATVQSFAATAGNSFVAGDKISLTVAIAGGVPVGAWSTIQYERT